MTDGAIIGEIRLFPFGWAPEGWLPCNGQTLELKGTYKPTLLPRRIAFFNHGRPSGRVDLVREGNTVTANTRRVSGFTLLISPDQFDLTKPIKVVADGKTVFEGTVRPDLATLLKPLLKRLHNKLLNKLLRKHLLKMLLIN